MIRFTTTALGAILLFGCAAQPELIRVADVPKTGEVFQGMPLRLKTSQIVQVWKLDPEKGEYVRVYEGRQMLADQSRLYAMDVKSGPFASPGLKVTQYADNTPKSVQVTSTQNVAGALDVATSVKTGVTAARNADTAAANAAYGVCQTARAAANTALGQVTAAQKALNDTPDVAANADLRDAYRRAIKEAQDAAAFALDNPQC